jgi:hypothetical protein
VSRDREDEPPGGPLRGPLRGEVEPSGPEVTEELPVVARLVVEIRSDGRRTVARGALEDAVLGQTVAVEARGDSPVQMAWALTRAMFRVPAMARQAGRALGLLRGRRDPRR